MNRLLRRIRRQVWPRVPDSVRDELALVRYESLKAQVPMLYVMLVLLVGVAFFGTPVPANPIIAFGMPLAIMSVITLRILIWNHRRDSVVTPAHARRMIHMMTISSCSVGLLASAWGVHSWSTAPHDVALYYPLLLSMGALSSAFCVSYVRSETVANLIICLVPISTALIISGQGLDWAAGVSILVAGAFLTRLILQQHVHLVAQLQLERQMRTLANSDELTGLLNRRGIRSEIAKLAQAEQGLALVLLDLDGFKAVNDRHGHAAGDILLTEVGKRLRAMAGHAIHCARLGGDEFAALIPDGTAAEATALADRILLSLVAPIAIRGQTVRVGASAGVADAAPGEVNVNRLFAKADGALYAVKRGRGEFGAERQAAVLSAR